MHRHWTNKCLHQDERKRAVMTLLQLFISFLQVGALSFGGGYASMPLIQEQVINVHHWLTVSEFTDLISISQMTPGPIAVNSATFVGIKIAGIPGAIVATIGCILPSILLVTVISHFYLKYRNLSLLQEILKMLRPAVVSLIATAGVSILVTAFFGESGLMTIKNIKYQMVVIFIICMVMLMKYRLDPVLVMVLAGVMNVAQYYIGTLL